MRELTVCFTENDADTSESKQARYYSLKVDLQAKGWRCHLWPVQVGARVMVDEASFNPLHALCKASVQVVTNLYESLASQAFSN